MSADPLIRVRRHLLRVILAAFVLVPMAGIGAGVLFGITDPGRLRRALIDPAFIGFMVLVTIWVGVHFHHFFEPLTDWLRRYPQGRTAPESLDRRLRRFYRHYWELLLAYALLLVPVYELAAHGGLPQDGVLAGLQLAALQVAAAVLVGLPPFLLALERLDSVVAVLGLHRVHISVRSKLMLVAGFVPLLSYAILLQYHTLTTGTPSGEDLAVWGGLALITILVAALLTRGMNRALAPVREMLRRSGASSHAELAAVRPRSSDEIGYMTQMLGSLFRRLGDQESHMRAVVDTAAEGIIVVDARGRIDTFNGAAERLFGYRAQEARGRRLDALLPDLVTGQGAPRASDAEQEVEGVHRNGVRHPMSVRVSRMVLSGAPMYTCLVADISKRKAAERERIAAEARYRDLVETAHDLVWSMDPEGRWTYLNAAARIIYGYSPGEMRMRPIRDFQAPERAEQDAAAFLDILQGREWVRYETVHLDRDARPHYLSFNAKPSYDENGKVTRITGTARDITEQKAFERRLTYQAEHDSLTGLSNRRAFQQELDRLVARVARSGAVCAVFYVDLDQFKYINDTLGHAAGDRLLVEISTLVSSRVREGDLFARFGGDEFTLLLDNVDEDRAIRAAENIRALVGEYRFLEGGNSFNVTCSVGVAMVNEQVQSADEVLSHADIACNIAKAQGRNRVNLYNPADRDKAGMAEDMGWAARVREMLEQDRFQLVFQPIVAIADGRVHDYEVLMRMPCDDGQVILPGGFMPAAERFGLIHRLDRWMVRQAIQRLAQLRASGTPVCFSVNLSGRAFEDDGLLPLIRRMLEQTQLDPAWLTFEITETAAIANLAAAVRFIRALKEIGCRFALDDFGAGFCSFTYLKHLPVDKLKIDGSFVQGLAEAPVDQAMVRSLNQVAHALGKVTIAEYVEDARTLRLLQEYGVDYAQGFYLGRPEAEIARRAIA